MRRNKGQRLSVIDAPEASGVGNELEIDANSGVLADLHAIKTKAMVAGQGGITGSR